MEKQNELILKLIANEAIEENDELFLQEIKCANSDPAFANNEVSRKRIEKAIDDSMKKSKNKRRKKMFVRVASVFLALLVGFSVVTLSVKGFREKLWEFLSNIGNMSYSSVISSKNKNDNLLASYEGNYLPKYIPDGYEVKEIKNSTACKVINFENHSGGTISFFEHPKEYEAKLNLDKEEYDSYEVKTVVGKEIIVATKDRDSTLIVRETDAVIVVVFNDSDIDMLGFVSYIEKK